MSNYTQTTFFAPKDALLTGNPLKLIKGADVDPEFAAIAAAITTKYDATNISSAPVGFADGTVNAPGITFAAQTNVGFFRIGTNDLGITVNGAQVVDFKTGVIVGAPTGGDKGAGTVNATGLFINGVAVTAGAGGANPTATVGTTAVNGTATTFLRSDGAPAIDLTMSPTWSGTHTFSGTGITTTFAGKVVIGPPSSGTALTINGVAAGTVLSLQDGTVNTQVQTGGATLQVGTISNHPFNLFTNNATRLAIAAAGNVTINAPSSGTTLVVNNTAADCFTANSTAANGILTRYQNSGVDLGYIGAAKEFTSTGTAGDFGIGSAGVTAQLVFGTNSTQRIIIGNAGNVTINAPSSGTALSLPNTASAVALSGANLSFGVGTAFVAGASELYTSSTSVLNIGTAGVAALGLYTNSLSRIAIASAGNVTINAPSSGVALTITGVSGSTSAIFNDGGNGVPMTFNSTNAAGGYIAFQRGTVNKAYIGDASQLSGGTLDDFTVRSEGGKLNLAISGVTKFSVVGSTALQGWGPVAAALVDMTPDTGSFTITYTGFTANPTGTAFWSRMGNQVLLFLPALGATSSQTTFTATGIPAAINPARQQWAGSFASGVNNGVPGVVVPIRVETNNTLTFSNGPPTVANTPLAWTNANAKSILTASTISYLLN